MPISENGDLNTNYMHDSFNNGQTSQHISPTNTSVRGNA